jgi:hypothetical protein
MKYGNRRISQRNQSSGSVGVQQHAATLTDDDGRDSGTSKDFDTGARFASPRAQLNAV